MRYFKETLLGVLMVVSFTSKGVEALTNTQVLCDDNSKVKLSKLAALRHNFRLKTAACAELEDEVRKAAEEVKKAAEALKRLENMLNTTVEDLEKLEINLTTCDIDELYCDGDIPTDCCQIKRMVPSAQSGLYAIKDPCLGDELFFSSAAKIAVYCDMETDGGGWIVIQRRNASLGRVNFVRNWEDYEKGFGDLDGEFWFGLKKIHDFTNRQRMRLNVSAWNDTGTLVAWNNDDFSIQGLAQRYALSGRGGIGAVGTRYSPFYYSGSNYFSTIDRDNDRRDPCTNCAYTDQGGWWYYNCDGANLNGRHQPTDLPGTRPLRQRLVWKNNRRQYDVYTHSEMKIRPYYCGLGSG